METKHPWWIKSVIIPVTLALIVGAGGSWMAANEAMVRYDERISELENKVERRPTKSESRSYTDRRFNEVMIVLTEVNMTSRASANDIQEIKQDIRKLEDK